MPAPAHSGEREIEEVELPADFAQRLESSLQAADRERRRRQVMARLAVALPVVLLIGPLIAWRLMLASPDGVHVMIESLAWLAFLLDVGVHIDSAVLTYVNLQAVPSVVGVALAVLLAAQLLWYPRNDE
jgi:uncharacterized Tic20 family protein